MLLKRTKQCKKFPWKVGVNPFDIPNGYCQKKHEGLIDTIADKQNPYSTLSGEQKVMACHETSKDFCIGRSKTYCDFISE